MAVADQEGGSGRWSLDHLFLDQDGVPTLVEVKRASDTRGRREVVAQMLDYAANAVSWWQLKDLQDAFALTCQKLQQTPGETLAKLLDQPEPDEEAYWKAVQSNLRSGRIRMLFVADVIYPELQRIIEFLNDQMNPAVVAGLELRAYQSGADKLIVPRLLGQTQKAQAAKSVSGVAFSGSPEGWAGGGQAEMDFTKGCGCRSPDPGVSAERTYSRTVQGRFVGSSHSFGDENAICVLGASKRRRSAESRLHDEDGRSRRQGKPH